MAYEFQVTVDCADPHALADWWAETLGWQVEPQDADFIRRMISEGYASDGDTTLHDGKLVWREGSAIRHPDGMERAPRVLFQLVPEAKTVKNRAHLDVRIGADDVDKVVAGLVARGATVLHSGRQGPHTWVTVADPEGNEFCVTPSAPPGSRTRTGPASTGAGRPPLRGCPGPAAPATASGGLGNRQLP